MQHAYLSFEFEPNICQSEGLVSMLCLEAQVFPLYCPVAFTHLYLGPDRDGLLCELY